MPKVGGRRRKTRTHKKVDDEASEILTSIPKSFIFKRGKVPSTIKTLVEDFREIMYPYTAIHLKESDKTNMKEYLRAAGYYQMSHMAIFTATKKSSYLRLLKNPGGPTLTFKILQYSNRRYKILLIVSNNYEILNIQRKFKSFTRSFSPALLIMNGFNVQNTTIPKLSDKQNPPQAMHIKLAATMIQSMFPPINVLKEKPENQKRAVLFTYDSERDLIYIRHYQILFNVKGVEKRMKKIIKANKLPDLSKYKNFSDFFGNDHQMFQSDTEASDIEGADMEVEQSVPGNSSKRVKTQMGVRLHEVGPRITIRLYKIEEALLTGNVIYNRIVRKNTKQLEKQRNNLRKRRLQKEERKMKQNQRVQEKEQLQNKKKVRFNPNTEEEPTVKRNQPKNNVNDEFTSGIQEFEQDLGQKGQKKIKTK